MKRKRVGQSLFAIGNKLRRNINKEHQIHGISGGQSRALNFIYRIGTHKDVFQKDIERFLSIRSSSATELVKSLVKEGFITKETLKTDKRMKKLILTDKGIEVVKNTHQILDSIEESLKNEVSKETFD